LIFLQNNLKYLTLSAFEDKDWTDIIPALTTKHYDTLTILYIYSDKEDMPLSFIASFLNLQELNISNFLVELILMNYNMLPFQNYESRVWNRLENL